MKSSEKGAKRYSSDKKGYVRKEYYDVYSEGPNKHDGYVDIYSSEKRKEKIANRAVISKIFYTMFFVVLGLIGSFMIYAYRSLNSFNYQDLSANDDDIILQDNDGHNLINDKMILNVMLIGSDSLSAGDQGRSDSLLILSLDMRHKKIKVTSLMRDIWLKIPGHGSDRFNAAYALGGPKLSIETIEKNFGIYIDRYAVVDFDGFSSIIDSLGGIDLELTSSECNYINKFSGDPNILKGSGIKHLTGLQTLHYARDRNSIGSDYDRTSRQRNVIKSVINKLKTANIAQITDLISKIGPMVTTNFKTSEISRLATRSLTYLNYPLDEFRLPTDDNVRDETYSQKMVLVINDMPKAKRDLLNFIYEIGQGDNTTENNQSKNNNTFESNQSKSNNTVENSQSKSNNIAKNSQIKSSNTFKSSHIKSDNTTENSQSKINDKNKISPIKSNNTVKNIQIKSKNTVSNNQRE